MSAEINKARPALRPAGNVTTQQESRASNNTRKLTKKPPASPPLKPSPALSVKISPPSSLPSTPRARNAALIKPVPSLKLASPKLCLRTASGAKLDTSLDHTSSPSAAFSTTAPGFDSSSGAASDQQGPCDGVQNDYASLVPLSVKAPDSKENASLYATNEMSSPASCDLIQLNSCHPPLAISSSQGAAKSLSTTSQRTSIRRGSLSRSSSDNFQRNSARHMNTNGCSRGQGFISCNSHSLDDAALAKLAAAKKAVASELSAQRKLKVLEYGRKPGKASKVSPEVPVVAPVNAEPPRCKFITAQSDPLNVAYHDQEWGVPVHDDRSLFELLVLAGAQVELSWTTILQKREVYRNVFCGYDPTMVASFNEKHIQSLEADKALMLQGGKVRGVVENARRVLEVVKEFGSLDTYLWSFLNYKPMINHYRYPKQIPAKTSKSEFISKDLVRRGFRFVGPTIVYSFMQCAGMSNDHLVQCFRHKACMIENHSSQSDAYGETSEEHFEVGLKLEHRDATFLDSKTCLHELELQKQHLSQHFTHSEFVHIEAY